MKWTATKRVWVVGLFLIATSVLQAQWIDTGLVVNGNFSQYPTIGWNITGYFVQLSSSDAQFSPYFVGLAPEAGEIVTASQEISGLVPNTNYKVTADHAFWGNNDPFWPSVRGAHSKLQITDLSGNELASYEQGYSGAWMTYEASFNSGSNTAIRVNLIGYGDEEPGWYNNYTTWFDNVKLLVLWYDTNKVVNGNFTAFPTDGWTIDGIFVQLASNDSRFAPYFVGLAPEVGQTVKASQIIPDLLPNTDYKVTADHAFWSNGDPYWPSVRGAHSKLQVTDLAGNELAVYEQGYSGAWMTYEVNFNSGSNTAVRVTLYGYGDEEPGWYNNYTTWFDNVKLSSPVPQGPLPPQNQAFNVPASNVITVDGNLSDWSASTDWSANYIWWNSFSDVLSSHTRAKFAWNQAQNMIYVAIETDQVNGGHAVVGLSKDIAGVPTSQTGATQLCFDRNTDGSVWIRNEIATYGIKAGGVADVQAACSYDAGTGYYTYELAIPLWNDWNNIGQGRQSLLAGDIVYLYSCMESSYGSANGTDLTYYGNPKFYNGAFNVASALTLLAGEVTPTPTPAPIPGDANNDNKVDVSDLGILAANYGTTAGATWDKGDFNHDGKVDVSDLGILAANYGIGTGSSLDFNADAKALGLTTEAKEDTPVTSSLGCGSAGLPMIAGLLLAGLSIITVSKLDD